MKNDKDIAVIGFDLNSEKIDLYRQGLDPTFEVGSEALKHSKIFFTDAEVSLREANFHIIAVPTPINVVVVVFTLSCLPKCQAEKNATVSVNSITIKELLPTLNT